MKLIRPNSKISLLLSKPQRPITLDEPHTKSKLGSNYDTGWSRRYGVRLIRAMLLDAVVRPGVELIASPEIKNQDRIDHLSAPVIFAANHSSHLDTPVMLSTLPAKFRHRCVVGAGADYFFDKRWKAILWSGVLSAIPIERSKPSRRAGELAVDLVKEGWNLLIFPEGGRTPDGLGQQHKTGVAQLAIRTRAPIVPIYLEGTYEILNKTSKRFKPGTVTASYGSPIYASDTDELWIANSEGRSDHHVDCVRAADADRNHSQAASIRGVAIGAYHHSARKGVLLDHDLVDNAGSGLPKSNPVLCGDGP